MMPNIFKFFKEKISASRLGVDIGTASLKIVEVGKGGDKPALNNYAIVESQSSLLRPNSVFQSSTLKLYDQEMARILKLALEKMKPQATLASASLSVFSVFTTILVFPEMTPEELNKAVAFQARQYIPMPISEVALDWLKVGEYTDDKGFRFQQILLISVPQEQIKKYQAIFKEAGLSLDSLEVESLSLIRALTNNDPTPSLLVDIGNSSTFIAVSENGQLKFSGQTDFAGASLTRSLASSLNINPLRAEELKKERGVLGTGPNYELSTIMMPFLDVIINEVRKAEFNYKSQFPNSAEIERVILSGGGANLLGIEKYFEKQLGKPAVKASPLYKFKYPAEMEPLVGELNPLLSVALGLALR